MVTDTSLICIFNLCTDVDFCVAVLIMWFIGSVQVAVG